MNSPPLTPRNPLLLPRLDSNVTKKNFFLKIHRHRNVIHRRYHYVTHRRRTRQIGSRATDRSPRSHPTGQCRPVLTRRRRPPLGGYLNPKGLAHMSVRISDHRYNSRTDLDTPNLGRLSLGLRWRRTRGSWRATGRRRLQSKSDTGPGRTSTECPRRGSKRRRRRRALRPARGATRLLCPLPA